MAKGFGLATAFGAVRQHIKIKGEIMIKARSTERMLSIMNTVVVCLVLCFSLACNSDAAGQPAKLVLNSIYSSPITSSDKSGFLDLLYKELFRRLNIPFEIQALPGERSLTNANEGIDDGEVCRIAALTKSYTNLVCTTEPVMQYQHVVFSRSAQFKVTGPESLNPYDVGIVTGWKIVELNTRLNRSRIMLDSPEQLFQMLDQGRVEVAVLERMMGMEMLNKLRISGVNILSPPLLTGDWHLFLHKRHSALIPRIDRELRTMKKDGSYDRIMREVMGRYIKGDKATGRRGK